MSIETQNFNFIYKTHRKRNGAFYVSARKYGALSSDKPEFTTCLFWNKRDAERAATIEANYRDNGNKFRFIDGWPVIGNPPNCPECMTGATLETGSMSGDFQTHAGYQAVDVTTYRCLSCGFTWRD